jgi:hypothetical protein
MQKKVGNRLDVASPRQALSYAPEPDGCGSSTARDQARELLTEVYRWFRRLCDA